MSEFPQPYPDAYCVKCGKHTMTQNKHTIVMSNSSRALKGVCPTCESEVYKIMPKVRAAKTRMALTTEELKRYPDAFCMKCKAHTPTANAHTVVLDNMSRAVTGACKNCGSEVFRILNHRQEETQPTAPMPNRSRWFYVSVTLVSIAMALGYLLLKK